ncbi:MAG: hypothetical protein FWH44_03035 [Methanomassiliicoccaceae archaeon]|nr:hypothetical protein [Methanomassiliicoccaceae archaeon]
MMMIARNAEYGDILNAVKGRNVAVWACNTCARMCNGVGGQQAGDRLAGKLKEDGVEVSASLSTSAACLMSKVTPKADMMRNADVVIVLACDIGVTCAAKAFGKDALAPLATLGSGFVDNDGTLVVTSCPSANIPATLDAVAEEKGMSTAPLV